MAAVQIDLMKLSYGWHCRPASEGVDFGDLGHIKTETVDLSSGVILQKHGARPRKLSTIRTPGPGSDDLEGNAHSAPGQRRGVDQFRSFEVLLRLTPLDVEKPDLRSGNLIDPLLNIRTAAKDNRPNLIVVMRRYFRNDIWSVQFHHLIDKFLAPHFLSFKGQVPVGEVIQADHPILGQLQRIGSGRFGSRCRRRSLRSRRRRSLSRWRRSLSGWGRLWGWRSL